MTRAHKPVFAQLYTKTIADLIDKHGADSAVGRQYLYDPAEEERRGFEMVDPIGDDAHSPCKGIVHRHKNRVLLKLTASCAVNCRFCFRKELLSRPDETLKQDEIEQALDYIQSKPQISEVILTGGDPLVLSPRRLKPVMQRLFDNKNLRNIRIHTRTPVADPARIHGAMIDALFLSAPQMMPLYIVLHINHVDEITDEFAALCLTLRQKGAILMSQSVLLKGINDNVPALQALFEAFVGLGIKPYYLHHPDLVPGTDHFRITFEHGQALMKALHGRLSGFALPSYVLDIPGGFSKVPVNADYIQRKGDIYLITDPAGGVHEYPARIAGVAVKAA